MNYLNFLFFRKAFTSLCTGARVVRVALVAVGMLVALSVAPADAGAVDFVSAQPQARVEYWERRQSEISAATRESRALAPVKLVFLGDSITDFWLLDDNPWVKGPKFGRSVWEANFSGSPRENLALNMGISGDRTEHVLYRIRPKSQGGLGQLDAPSLQPEFVMLMIGVNNTWAAEEPVVGSVVAGVRAVLKAVHERKPKARVILQSLLPTSEAARNRDVIEPVNRELVAMAESAEFSGFTRFLALYPLFLDAQGAQNAALFVSDGVHPNRQGYEVWRDSLVPFLQAQRAGSALPAGR
jgi:lysophospholipase L1-like esterase